MAKYDPLVHFFARCKDTELTMRFSEIESVLEAKLPPSARKYREWWNEGNGSHYWANAWMAAGYRLDDLNQTAERVRFVKR